MSETNAAYCRSGTWPAPAPFSDAPAVARQPRRRPSPEPFLAVKTLETPMPFATPAADAAVVPLEEVKNWKQVVPPAFAREFSCLCEELFV
ncbi:MAG: hypothetical protein K0R38_7202, partial [Polyangiaceae bacterium]|nr:hypothetical protein [Polyangiaceae bacterium]